MHRLKKSCTFWTIVAAIIWNWPEGTSSYSTFVSSKKGLMIEKWRNNEVTLILEVMRSDMKKMQSTVNRMAEKLENMEKFESHLLDESKEKRVDNGMSGGGANFESVNFTRYFNQELFSNKLERISKIQERNSRMLIVEMTALTNLESSFGRLENLINSSRQPEVEWEKKSFQDSSASSKFQLRVIDQLTSIDHKLSLIQTFIMLQLPKVSPGKNHCEIASNNTNISKPNKEAEINNEKSSEESNKIPKLLSKRATESCESLSIANATSGVYLLEKKDAAFVRIWGNVSEINCNMESNGGGWTVIQRRGGFYGGKVNFTKNWNEYANGFGQLNAEFWFGNEVVHRMTSYHGKYALRVELEDWDGQTAWAEYSTFELSSNMDGYRIKIAGYSGNATDSLSAHYSTPFSTYDRRNDFSPLCCPCTTDYGGGWWYYSCFEANLNGNYYRMDEYRKPYRGIIWEHWRDDYSLKSTKMMIRSNNYNSPK